MTTAYIKNTLIEKVKKMSNRDAKKFYELMVEHNLNDSLYKFFEDIPHEHKLALNKGFDDLKKGRKQQVDVFKNQHQIRRKLI